MGEVTTALNTLFSHFQRLQYYLLALAGLGSLTMAVLQVVKDTTPARRWFQMYRFRACLREHAKIAKQDHGIDACACKAEEEIVLLATDSDAEAFYDLEIEKMCGQWNAANQIAIDSPKLYPNFFACVAARAQKKDFEIVWGRMLPPPLPPHEEAVRPMKEQEERLQTRHAFAEARTRVSHQIQRTVDAFQISASFRWSWLLKLASFAISYVFVIAAVALNLDVKWGNALLSAALAGFLAPIARDLLASLQKLRG